MKFIFFNLAVVAALFYLFQADRSDFRAAADRAYDAVDNVHALAKDVAKGAARQGNRLLKDSETPAADPGEWNAPTPGTAEAPPAPPPAPVVTSVPAGPADTASSATDAVVQASPPPVDPAVARRRAEVLGSGDGQPALPASALAPALVEGATLMAPEERRRQLFSLAEDMEFMFVKRVSR